MKTKIAKPYASSVPSFFATKIAKPFVLPMQIVRMFKISSICRPKISPPKVIYKVQSMPYKSLPLGTFWTIFGRIFPTGVLQLLYPYQPANPLVEKTLITTNSNMHCSKPSRHLHP